MQILLSGRNFHQSVDLNYASREGGALTVNVPVAPARLFRMATVGATIRSLEGDSRVWASIFLDPPFMHFSSTSVDRWFRALLLPGLVSAAAAAAVPELEFAELPESREFNTEDGVVSLSWTPLPAPWAVELQQGSEAGFGEPVRRYQGRDSGSVLTGLPEGHHAFRIRAVHPEGEIGAWTEPVKVQVAFMDRGRLYWFLGLGGIVVLATAGSILVGYLAHRHELDQEVAS